MSRSRVVDVGIPPDNFNGWTTTEVCIHGFANIIPAAGQNEKDVRVDSAEFSCFGHQWILRLYPYGSYDNAMDPDEGYASIRLAHQSDSPISIYCGFSVRNARGKEVEFFEPDIEDFGDEDLDSFGYSNFAERSALMGSLINGTLVIEVRMRLDQSDISTTTQYVPTNPITKNILKLFNDEETADVVFEVGLQQAGIKRAKTLRVKFHAHRLVLKNNCSVLYDMCGVSDGGGITTVSITDVSPTIFKHMLYCVYGGKLSEEELKANTKDIINACGRYGVVHLKLEAEACYVKSTTITVENMIDNLLYADSKNLAFLKEAVMDYIVRSKHGIIGKESLDTFPGHLVTELLTAMARREKGKLVSGAKIPSLINGEDSDVKRNKIRVGTLRKMMDEKGLDVDGSREEMVARLFKKEETKEGESS